MMTGGGSADVTDSPSEPPTDGFMVARPARDLEEEYV
jgi:hypothetical protein